MDFMVYLEQIFDVCIVPLLGVLTTFIIQYLQAKKSEIKTLETSELSKKYLEMLNDTIQQCVIATNQTYVDSLKDKNAFDADAQKIAFEKTFNSVMKLLTDESKEYLSEMYGDLNDYITEKIEAEVYTYKKIV